MIKGYEYNKEAVMAKDTNASINASYMSNICLVGPVPVLLRIGRACGGNIFANENIHLWFYKVFSVIVLWFQTP